ncbi:MAG: hypothetical protein RML14_06885 [Meiothermus sp.]|nr:hypothetical protein [Meiothermus sp.]MDW8481592.1 hypothetical protein [Meiothermus sp.]
MLSGRFRFQVGPGGTELASGDLLCIPGGLKSTVLRR